MEKTAHEERQHEFIADGLSNMKADILPSVASHKCLPQMISSPQHPHD